MARLRDQRKMTQQMLADRIGKSKSWVDKVERGVRRLDKFSVLQDIARVLQVEVAVLLDGDAQSGGASRAAHGVDRVRAALACYDLAFGGRDEQVLLPLDELRRRVEYAWSSYRHAHYPQLLRLLPDLLGDARRAQAADRATPGAARLLVQVYRIMSSVLVKVGDPELAWLAADRATAVAVSAGDRLGTALAAVPLGQALRALGQGRLAVAVTVTAAHYVAPAVPHDAPPVELSVCGTLLIEAALAAASGDDPSSAEELIDQAAEIAEQVGAGHDHEWTSFGPPAVESARVALAVELGEGAAAVDRHEQTIGGEAWRRLPAEHRGAHLLAAAQAYLQVGDLIGAGRVLIDADRTAPAEIRSRPLARTVIGDLVRGGRVPPDVAQLAAALGLA